MPELLADQENRKVKLEETATLQQPDAPQAAP
jgi:hypothetical protein